MLVVSVSGTKSYLHAFHECIRSIAAAASHHEAAVFIFCTDHSEESKSAEKILASELPSGWTINTVRFDFDSDSKDYKNGAQLRIAKMQGAAFAAARSKYRADTFWNVESDNIVPANSLRVLEWTLQMPDSDGKPIYDVAAGTYQNGLFLGGFGTYQNPIAEDFKRNERVLKPRLKFVIEKCEERLKTIQGSDREKEGKRFGRLMDRVKKCSPDGNVWEITAKHGWRRRGWMDFAYPGIGEGSVVPSDWCGLGCTLLSKRALALADFNGYEGSGTQDLFLCWRRWHPSRIRIACVPHVLCDHVKKDGDKITHYRAFHEPEGEHKGHIRSISQPWIPSA